MATFTVTAEQASPLQIQLGALSGVGCEVRYWSAWAENTVGSTSRPILYRPSQPGFGRADNERLRVGCDETPGLLPQIEVLTQFSKSPSYPDVPMVRTNYPYRISVAFPPGQGFIILPNNYGMLYARVDFLGQPGVKNEQDRVAQKGGFQWNAELKFEQL